jgi:predicted HTH transcriptional regulator
VVQAARNKGPTIVQDFHLGWTKRGEHLDAILSDVCAFADTNGGTVYVGVSANPREQSAGVKNPSRVLRKLREAI